MTNQQAKIEQQERVLKDKKEELDEREEAIEKGEEKLADDQDNLREKIRKFEEADQSKRELRDQIHQLNVDKEKDKEKYENKLEELNQKLNDKCCKYDDLKTQKEHLEAVYKDILKKKDDEITRLNNELTTYKHSGETESNRILIGGVDYPMQDDSDK